MTAVYRLGPAKKEPYWITILPEIPGERSSLELQVRPLSPALRSAAESYARAKLAALKEAGVTETEIGQLADPNVVSGMWRKHYVTGLGVYGIVGWRGVGDESGNPIAEPFKAGIEGLLENDLIFELFHADYTSWLERLELAKNASRPAPTGTSAAGRSTAKAAATPTPPVPAASPDKTARAAPTTKAPRKRSRKTKPST